MAKRIKSVRVTLEDGSQVDMPFGEFLQHSDLYVFTNAILEPEEHKEKFGNVPRDLYE